MQLFERADHGFFFEQGFRQLLIEAFVKIDIHQGVGFAFQGMETQHAPIGRSRIAEFGIKILRGQFKLVIQDPRTGAARRFDQIIQTGVEADASAMFRLFEQERTNPTTTADQAVSFQQGHGLAHGYRRHAEFRDQLFDRRQLVANFVVSVKATDKYLGELHVQRNRPLVEQADLFSHSYCNRLLKVI